METVKTVILQNIQKLPFSDDRFYAKAVIGGEGEVRALLDCGSMACALKSAVLPKEVYGCRVLMPTLVVDGQCDDLILGSNLLKHLSAEVDQRLLGQGVHSCQW